MDTLAQPALLSLAVHIAGVAVFAGVFLFLHRESRIVYFGYWASAWALLGAALLLRLGSEVSGRTLFLLPFVALKLAFVASLLFAGASVERRPESRLSSAALLALVLALAAHAVGAFSDFQGFYAVHTLLLAGAYGWNFVVFRRLPDAAGGAARKLFSTSLLASSLFQAHSAVLYAARLAVPSWTLPGYLRYYDLYDLGLETLIAFSAMMMWMEAQHEQLRQINEELARSRSQMARDALIDPLTGLMNRTALNQMCDSKEPVSGVVGVVDLDNFKDINDTLGHLIGDEVLANVGNLIKTSVRKDDLAWRWGGDEFVLLFSEQSREAVEERLQEIADRLQRFRLRGKGVLPINLSWGVAEVRQRSLRQALEEADHYMYLRKRDKASGSKFFGATQSSRP